MTILRRYIGKRLNDYFAQPSGLVVGSPSKSIDFRNLLGEWQWRRIHRQLYKEQQGQWLTPVELFYPFYSQILAEFCVNQQALSSVEFEIYEFGAGRGTNAIGILSHLQQQHPDVYERLNRYTLVDSSPTLHNLQKQTLLPSGHLSKCDFLQRDLTDVAESKAVLFSEPSNIPTLFIGMEVLDNLGHDKVQRDAQTRQVQNAYVENGSEIFLPLSDPLLRTILLNLPSYGGKFGHPIWVPSVACGVLQHVSQSRPNSWMVLADFDFLPCSDDDDTTVPSQRSTLEADGEPLVTDMKGLDYSCYLNSPPLCDILFPTDFKKLQNFSKKIFPNKQVSFQKQSDFFIRYGKSMVQSTTSRWTGYCPMIQDYYNSSVLTVSSKDV
jgi:SAM-dependent MidA family methyltransferase